MHIRRTGLLAMIFVATQPTVVRAGEFDAVTIEQVTDMPPGAARRTAHSLILSQTAIAVEDTTMQIISSAFASNTSIPPKYTCDGKDISPALTFSGIPKAAKSLVLIVDDPDAPDPAAPKMTWVHWVLYNLPPATDGLPEGVTHNQLPTGTREGLNDWKRTGYGGPCPPVGRHRYFHKLYALDTMLPDLGKATKSDVERAMKGHVLAEAQLVGTYQH
jgi:Raf kinase inhibitor-like YbhB/YbcL family protein